jgi:predicted ATP-grasp superfamily ATP-dependent carboligase
MARVFVTDGDERSALAVVRSLGRAGHTVVVGARRFASLSGASRFASARVELPDPLVAPDAFADVTGAAVRAHGCDVVLPVTDASVLALLTQPDAVAPARMPLPPLDRFRRVSDKAAVGAAAAAIGIRVPRQVRSDTRDEIRGLSAARQLVPPLVLKPARSVAGGEAGRTKHGVVHAADWPTAARLASSLPDGAFPLLIQERIVGPGTGIFLLVWGGRLVAAFAHRRVREKPPAGGVSVVCESVALDLELLARSEALLRCFDWSGVAMIEYKRDAATAEAVLMEINGRFWGSLQLAVDAGVDFPRLLLECALGGTPAPAVDYRVGIRNRWWWGDADHLLARLRRSATALNLPPGSPGRLHAALDFLLTGFGGAGGQVFQADDAGPARRELRDRVRELLGM